MDYQRVYSQLIAQAVVRGNLDGYCEKHHITPRSMGGLNTPDNLVRLTAREHFIAHRLLYKIHKNAAMARAFCLLTHDQNQPKSRVYATAKAQYAETMRGQNNVAKRTEVKIKISKALSESHPFKGKTRPQHAALLRERGYWAGENSLWFGTGERQRGALNHMARAITGTHPSIGIQSWQTLKQAADDIGVSVQAVCQALKRGGTTKSWRLEYV